MFDRRTTLAILAVTLLVTGMLVVQRPAAEIERPLEAASLTGPIASAIEAGAASSLSGLLPTSEPYQRAMKTVDGLKAGVPSPMPTLSASQLSDIEAIAAGAAAGTIVSPGVVTSAAERAVFTSFAQGYMREAVKEIAGAPSAGRRALDDAVAEGTFSALAGHVLGPNALLSPAIYESYAGTFARSLFDELGDEASLVANLAGSPALADIAMFTNVIVSGQLDSIPTAVTNAQLAAIATFGAGGVDGMIEGMVTSFPQGTPGPSETDLLRWFDALAEGHEGTPPWETPSSLPFLFAWADAVGAAAVNGVAEAGDQVPEPEHVLVELEALATGLAQGGYTHLAALVTAVGNGDVERDVRAYAAGLTGPGIDYIISRPGLPSSPEAITAYATGLTAGLEDLVGSSARGLGLTEEYLANLMGAVTDFPATTLPGNGELVKEFAEGITNNITRRLDVIARAAVHEDDPEILEAMAVGIAQAAVALVGGPQMADPTLLDSFGDALMTGFLESTNPSDLWTPLEGLSAAITAWGASGPPIVPNTFVNDVRGGAAAQHKAVTEFGETWGMAPVNWAVDRAVTVQLEATYGTLRDALWMTNFSKDFGEAYAGSLQAYVTDPKINTSGLTNYADAAIAAASLSYSDAAAYLTGAEFQGHATRFAEYLATPFGWILDLKTPSGQAAAMAVVDATLANANDTARFTNATYAAGVIAYVAAIGDGLQPGGDPKVPTNVTPPWVEGVMTAILDLPNESMEGDISARILWVSTTTGVAEQVVTEATQGRAEAITAYADAVTSWALATDDHIPHPGDLDKPLLPFLEASIGGGLAKLPPILSPAEREAAVSYLFGIVRAVDSLPPYDFEGWTGIDEVAMTAYVTGIAGGVLGVVEDTNVWICQEVNKEYLCGIPPPECSDRVDNDGDGLIDHPADPGCRSPSDPDERPERLPECSDGLDNDNDNLTDHPHDPQCASPADDSEGEHGMCRGEDRDCLLQNYITNVGVWAQGLTAAIIDPKTPDVSPTLGGVEMVKRWATEALAGEGVCVPAPGELPGCGPGRFEAFALATAENVNRTAHIVAAPFTVLLPLDRDPLVVASSLSDPSVRWLNGIVTATKDASWTTENLIITDEGRVLALTRYAPPTSVTDPDYAQKFEAWNAEVAKITGDVQAIIFADMPHTPGVDANLDTLSEIYAEAIWRGGFQAIDESSRNATLAAKGTTPNVSLRAWAEGLAPTIGERIVDPASGDVAQLLAWYAGVAQGGVAAILAAESIPAAQLPLLENYATWLGETFVPPLPPTNDLVGSIGSGGGGSMPGGGGGGGLPSDPTQTDPRQQYLNNLQAHAAGIAAAVLQGPPQGGAQAGFGYVRGIVNAASALPTVEPSKDYATILQDWTQAQAAAAIAANPTTIDRLTPTPDQAFILGYLEGFAGTSPWNLPPDVTDKLGWAEGAVLAGLATACPRGVSAEGCGAIGDAIGEALAQTLPEKPDVPDETRVLTDILQGVIDGLEDDGGSDPDPEPDPGEEPESNATLVPLVMGLVDGLIPAGQGSPNLAPISAAITQALVNSEPQLPPVATRTVAEALAAALLTADPSRYHAMATGAVAFVQHMSESDQEDPGAMQSEMQPFLSSTASGAPVVTVTDGARSASNGNLDGKFVFDGLANLVFRAYPPASSPSSSGWELWWSNTDPQATSAKKVTMTAEQGHFRATLLPADLAGLPAGGRVNFLVVERAGPTTTPYGSAGESSATPFGLKADRDMPAATITVPSATGSSFTVRWSGTDVDSSVATYKVESRDGDGAWTEWIRATSDKEASFSGVAGHAYSFRATATDVVGHVGAPSSVGSTTVPAGAAENRAPTVSFRAPTTGSVFGKSVAIELALADPDGTQPSVRLCLRKAGASSDLECPLEGSRSSFSLDTTKIADGSYQLVATATDGTMSATATSGIFRIDRMPPAFRGAAADPTSSRVVLTAALDKDVSTVVAETGGRSVSLADDGKGADAVANDGTWTSVTTLPPGEHTLTFRATDVNGNQATFQKKIVVPAPPPPAGSAGGPSTPPKADGPAAEPEPGEKDPDPPAEGGKKKVPAPHAALGLLALAGLALAMRRRRA